MKTQQRAILYALLAAALYAINIPLSKLLLHQVPAAMMAAFLYLGAGAGLFLYGLASGERKKVEPLTKADMPYTVGMILLDIAAPILLMLGLECTSSANASLLNNFEIVATTLIAALVFKEALSRRLIAAIALVTAASIVLSFEGEGSFQFNDGSLLVLAAACCWGLENNCTRKLSGRSSVQITTIKGIFCGIGSLAVALISGESLPAFRWIPVVMLLGFVAYGLSINFYIRAQKNLGAAKPARFIPSRRSLARCWVCSCWESSRVCSFMWAWSLWRLRRCCWERTPYPCSTAICTRTSTAIPIATAT